MTRKNDNFSSRELLARIGLGDENPTDLLDDEPLEDLGGDLGGALRERYRAFAKRQRFAPGDLVTWKPGLKNRRWPRYGRPAVVVEVLETPIFDSEHDTGSTYFREPLDVALGLIWESDPCRGDFVTFYFDSRRLQLLEKKQ